MNNIIRTRAKIDSAAALQYAIPALLAVNTAALFALDQLGGIPTWIKSAAALFLAF
jgi:hypothetical protein